MKSGIVNSVKRIISNREVQKLLLALKNGEINVIEPVIEFNEGIGYPLLSKFLGRSEAAEEAITILSEAGILLSDIVSNVIVCPRCGSYKLMLRMSCPSCGSTRIVRGVMIEHADCGHIDFEEAFKGADGGLVCPHCKETLKAVGEDYRVYSFLHRCLSCGNLFQNPKIRYLCHNGHAFEENSLSVMSVKAYRLNPESKGLLEQLTVELKDIVQPLEEIGWKAELSPMILGASGATHEFTFVASKKGSSKGGGGPHIVASLHSSEGEVGATDVLAFWAKATDVGADRKVMMVVPKLSAEGKTLAEAYGVDVVEGETAKELQAKTKELLRQIAVEADETEGKSARRHLGKGANTNKRR